MKKTIIFLLSFLWLDFTGGQAQAQSQVASIRIDDYVQVVDPAIRDWVGVVCPCAGKGGGCDCQDFDKQTYLNLNLNFERPRRDFDMSRWQGVSFIYVKAVIRYPINESQQRRLVLPIYVVDLRQGQFNVEEIPEGANILRRIFFRHDRLVNAFAQLEFRTVGGGNNVATFEKAKLTAQTALRQLTPAKILEPTPIPGEKELEPLDQLSQPLFQGNDVIKIVPGATERDSLKTRYSYVYVLNNPDAKVYDNYQGLTVTRRPGQILAKSVEGGETINAPFFVFDIDLKQYFDDPSLPSTRVIDLTCSNLPALSDLARIDSMVLRNQVLGEYQKAREQDLFAIIKRLVEERSKTEDAELQNLLNGGGTKEISKEEKDKLLKQYDDFLFYIRKLDEELKHRDRFFRDKYLNNMQNLQRCFQTYLRAKGITTSGGYTPSSGSSSSPVVGGGPAPAPADAPKTEPAPTPGQDDGDDKKKKKKKKRGDENQ
ncbi:MAG: hypothetical protein MUC97_02340 [Bernardetiaceae bacterium]|jgi:hypothetical protein|nr:hypothetical protein [Bernardetiaceae bacterium]